MGYGFSDDDDGGLDQSIAKAEVAWDVPCSHRPQHLWHDLAPAFPMYHFGWHSSLFI